jgi:hypothetical protein
VLVLVRVHAHCDHYILLIVIVGDVEAAGQSCVERCQASMKSRRPGYGSGGRQISSRALAASQIASHPAASRTLPGVPDETARFLLRYALRAPLRRNPPTTLQEPDRQPRRYTAKSTDAATPNTTAEMVYGTEGREFESLSPPHTKRGPYFNRRKVGTFQPADTSPTCTTMR